MKCIYCLLEKRESDFLKREHVIPQMFGRFNPDNLILRNCVCDECNQFFGDKIELFWGRDSLEGIERLRHGIKPKDSLNKRKRVTSKIINGDFKGVIVREVSISETGNMLGEKPVQVGFYHNSKNEYHYFEIDDIPFPNQLTEQGYDIKNRIIMLIGDEEEVQLLKNILKEKGIPLGDETVLIKEHNHGEITQVEVEATLDRVIMRGICKIAFNYLAYIVGKQFILNNNFNGIRNFIRNDEGKSEKYLSVNKPPILHDDQKLEKYRKKITEGHLITLGWENERNIVSKVSIFNLHTYGICLCENYDGLWIPLKYGHHFNIESKEVSKLLVLPRELIP